MRAPPPSTANFAALQATGLMFNYMARPDLERFPEAKAVLEKKVEGSFGLVFSVAPDGTVYNVAPKDVTAGIEPVGSRPAGEIVRRLADRSEAARTPPLSLAEAEAVRRYLAVSGAPTVALDAIRALAGPATGALDAALEGWRRRLADLTVHGVPADRVTLTAAFGRAFGYYDGMVFEVRSAALGEERPVAAGGRYDGLPVRLGAAASKAAVGCMVRPARAFAGGVE